MAVWVYYSLPLVPKREERLRVLPTMMEAAMSVVPRILAMLALSAAAVDRALLVIPPLWTAEYQETPCDVGIAAAAGCYWRQPARSWRAR
jgi:hypothetical protein